MTTLNSPIIDKDYDVWIFIPGINDYVEVVGATMKFIDGKQYLRIICKTSTGDELLINPIDLEIYFRRHNVVF